MTDTAEAERLARQEKIRETVSEGAKLVGKLMVQRKDVKATYGYNPRSNEWHWAPVDEPFKLKDFVGHFQGQACLGTYMLDTEGLVKFLAFDVDLKKENAGYQVVRDIDEIVAREDDYAASGTIDLDFRVGNLEAALHDPSNEAHRWARIVLLDCIRSIRRSLAKNFGNQPSMTVITGGGAHIIVPFEEPIPAVEARMAGIEVVQGLTHATPINDIYTDYGAGGYPPIRIEVFPKQNSMEGKSYGNLLRLPFGWHREAGIRTYAINPDEHICPNWEWRKISSIGELRRLAQAVGG